MEFAGTTAPQKEVVVGVARVTRRADDGIKLSDFSFEGRILQVDIASNLSKDLESFVTAANGQ